jgi:hypothetical protein
MAWYENEAGARPRGITLQAGRKWRLLAKPVGVRINGNEAGGEEGRRR